jgi:RNAse (barnase) inhibitor barstar
MNSQEKLQALDDAKAEMGKLKKAQTDLYQETKEKLGLSEKYDRDLWDFLVIGLRFARHEIEVALHTNEGKDA